MYIVYVSSFLSPLSLSILYSYYYIPYLYSCIRFTIPLSIILHLTLYYFRFHRPLVFVDFYTACYKATTLTINDIASLLGQKKSRKGLSPELQNSGSGLNDKQSPRVVSPSFVLALYVKLCKQCQNRKLKLG